MFCVIPRRYITLGVDVSSGKRLNRPLRTSSESGIADSSCGASGLVDEVPAIEDKRKEE